MNSPIQVVTTHPEKQWRMPITPEDYDRSPLSVEEQWALEQSMGRTSRNVFTQESRRARHILTRLDQPLLDAFHLRHRECDHENFSEVRLLMQREMHHRRKMFWDWSELEWREVLCATTTQFYATYGFKPTCHISLIDVAYLLGGVTDLRSAGMAAEMVECAALYFGSDLIAEQCKRVVDVLTEKGYGGGPASVVEVRRCLSTLFVLNRSPYLENLSEQLFVAACQGGTAVRNIRKRMLIAFEHLGLFSPPSKEMLRLPNAFDSSGMALEWYAWCIAWYERATDLSPRQQQAYVGALLVVGRWLAQHDPEVSTPEQWTEDLALRFRSDVCSWVNGQYAGDKARQILERKGKLGAPLQASGIDNYLKSLRRFFTDLTRKVHAVNGAPARRITLDFSPKEIFTSPKPIRQALNVASPRDVDLHVWAKLTIAAATLSADDLPQGTWYPLSLFRAIGLIWVTSARRPNEILRLRLECLREEWASDMYDEDDHPVEKPVHLQRAGQPAGEAGDEKSQKICYLHIPSGKNRGPFWIWVPGYVADAIKAWKQERPRELRQLPDRKDREYVDYLFCYKDERIGARFINSALIPTLCKRAGIAIEDAKGRITGHRGRSSRLTFLRSRGVSLDDLAEYAGHMDHRTIRRYARQHPLQLHRIIRDADDISRVIEGIVDLQAAAQGLAALRWFIGYDADGEPMYCANQVYHTCPHRLDCPKCGMFIGGEKARLLHEGEATLPVTSKVPMTPIEKCVVNGDQAGAEACRTALQQVPAPETPDLTLIFNPEGLSNGELEKLAQLGTHDALSKLRRALEAHQERLVEIQQSKTGRSALVGAQKKRISLLEALIVDCELRLRGQHSENQAPMEIS